MGMACAIDIISAGDQPAARATISTGKQNFLFESSWSNCYSKASENWMTVVGFAQLHTPAEGDITDCKFDAAT
jgi:hypothetical protein